MEAKEYLELYLRFKKDCLEKSITDVEEILKLFEGYVKL